MKTARIYTNDFNRLISATKSFCAPKDAIRKENRYIKLEFDADHSIVTAYAIDGYRLATEHAVVSDCEEGFIAYIMPPNIKLPNKMYAEITLDNNELQIRCNGVMFGYEQPQINDPFNYDKFISNLNEKTPSFRIGFNGNYLISALQAAKVSCGDSFRQPIILEFTKPNEPVVLRTNKEDIKLVLPVRLKD
jgi:DNA polymerase III sliding clamp (beta) subunit (PCNA family)